MVKGIEKFRAHFKDHKDKFILIGGTACDILMDEVDLEFRATKDIDIVLIVEAIDPEFVKVFWDFIKQGSYENIQKSTGEKESSWRSPN
jgi:predicted nucleotidyltransferase